MRTISQIDIRHKAFVHAWLHREVEHRFIITVINTGDSRQIASLVIHLNIIYNRCRKILHGSLGVTCHELLTAHFDLLHLFSVNGDLSVFTDLCTRQTLHKFLNHRSFRSHVSSGVIDKGVFLHYHLQRLTCHIDLTEHLGVALHLNRTQVQVFITNYLKPLEHANIADTGNTEKILSVLGSCDGKSATLVRYCSCNKCTVHCNQLNRGLHHRLLCLAVYQHT